MLQLHTKKKKGTTVGNNGAIVESIRFVGDDAALLKALKNGHPGAPNALYDRFADHIEGILNRILGFDSELADVLHEVFVQALANIDSLKNETRLKVWLTSVAIFTAKGYIRKNIRRRWLRFDAPQQLPELTSTTVDHEELEALRQTYAIINQLSVNHRLAFTLRHIDGMEHTQVAQACNVSLSTIKRWLARAEKKFETFAQKQPVLRQWLEEGSRWKTNR